MLMTGNAASLEYELGRSVVLRNTSVILRVNDCPALISTENLMLKIQ